MAYDSQGKAFEDSATEAPIKRSGFLDGAIASEEDFDKEVGVLYSSSLYTLSRIFDSIDYILA